MGTNTGAGANVKIDPAVDMAAFDRLPPEIRHFISVYQLQVSPLLAERRLLDIHKGHVESWISEAELLFPQFRDSVVKATWGNDHPSIDGPILEDDYVLPRRPARTRRGR